MEWLLFIMILLTTVELQHIQMGNQLIKQQAMKIYTETINYYALNGAIQASDICIINLIICGKGCETCDETSSQWHNNDTMTSDALCDLDWVKCHRR